MSHDQQQMESYYRARAAEYDRIYLKPERQHDLAAIRSWLPGKFVGARVLEIACGTGYWTQFIAPVATAITAIDTAPETLDIARSRVPDSHATFVVGDAYAPPQEPPFDAAFAGFWFSHVPKARRQAFLRGLAGCLRPQATVVFIDNLYVAGSSSPITEHGADGNTFQTRRLADGSSHQVIKNFPTENELIEAVGSIAASVTYTRWEYFWALEFAVADTRQAPSRHA